MLHLLNTDQKRQYLVFREFVEEFVAPYASAWDEEQYMPAKIIRQCAEAGFTGGILPSPYGGGGWDMIRFGLLNEAFGRASSSLTGLFTVQAMVAMAILRWGREEQKQRWLPPISSGDMVASFALTEPSGGSNIQSIETSFTSQGGSVVVNGEKNWITFSEYAGIFLVFGKLDGQHPAAFVIERDTSGISIEPIKGMMGFRAAHLSTIRFEDCVIPAGNMIGKPGFGLSCVANLGLHYGRISTAWSSAGLMRACLEESVAYARTRKTVKGPVSSLRPIRDIITEMGIRLEAVQMLCWQASLLEDRQSTQAIDRTLMAKWMASTEVVKAAGQAVQIQGAAGCHGSSQAARCYRDSKIMEIIEGTTQVCLGILGDTFLNDGSIHRAGEANSL